MARSERVRKIAEAERAAYDEAFERHRTAQYAAAQLAGFAIHGGDPPFPWTCPTCAASVSLSAIPKHLDWHASL